MRALTTIIWNIEIVNIKWTMAGIFTDHGCLLIAFIWFSGHFYLDFRCVFHQRKSFLVFCSFLWLSWFCWCCFVVAIVGKGVFVSNPQTNSTTVCMSCLLLHELNVSKKVVCECDTILLLQGLTFYHNPIICPTSQWSKVIGY